MVTLLVGPNREQLMNQAKLEKKPFATIHTGFELGQSIGVNEGAGYVIDCDAQTPLASVQPPQTGFELLLIGGDRISLRAGLAASIARGTKIDREKNKDLFHIADEMQLHGDHVILRTGGSDIARAQALTLQRQLEQMGQVKLEENGVGDNSKLFFEFDKTLMAITSDPSLAKARGDEIAAQRREVSELSVMRLHANVTERCWHTDVSSYFDIPGSKESNNCVVAFNTRPRVNGTSSENGSYITIRLAPPLPGMTITLEQIANRIWSGGAIVTKYSIRSPIGLEQGSDQMSAAVQELITALRNVQRN